MSGERGIYYGFPSDEGRYNVLVGGLVNVRGCTENGEPNSFIYSPREQNGASLTLRLERLNGSRVLEIHGNIPLPEKFTSLFHGLDGERLSDEDIAKMMNGKG
jgi:hypothetical protein